MNRWGQVLPFAWGQVLPFALESGLASCGSGAALQVVSGQGEGGAVGAARRLPCGARSELALHNSLRELRSLRSDRCSESEDEARLRRAEPAPALLGAPGFALAGDRLARLGRFRVAQRCRFCGFATQNLTPST